MALELILTVVAMVKIVVVIDMMLLIKSVKV